MTRKAFDLPPMNESAGGPGIHSNGDLTKSRLKTFHATIKIT